MPKKFVLKKSNFSKQMNTKKKASDEASASGMKEDRNSSISSYDISSQCVSVQDGLQKKGPVDGVGAGKRSK